MAESTKKKRTSSSPKTSKARSARSTAKAPATRPEKRVTAPANEVSKNITHRTSSEPSNEKLASKLPDIKLESIKTTLTSKRFWTWVGAVVLSVLVVLFAWWQWQRSYVAVVNGQYIKTSDLHDQLLANSGSQTLDTLMQQQLISQEGQKHNIVIEEAQIQEELTDFIESSGGEESYRSSLREFGISEDLLRDQVRVRLTLEELLADKIQVSDEEIEEYYNANKAEVDVANEGLEAASERIEIQLREQKLGQESAKYLESLQSPASMSREINNASLTFWDFVKEDVFTIPTDVWSLLTQGF